MKNLLLTLVMALAIPLAHAADSSFTLMTGGTNNAAAVSTNTSVTAYVAGDDFEYVGLFASAKAMPTDTDALGSLNFVFAQGDGTIYETTPRYVFVLPLTATNVTLYAATNFNLGGIPKLKLVALRHTSTNDYATNITLRYWRKTIETK